MGRRPLATRQPQAGRRHELVDDAGHIPRRVLGKWLWAPSPQKNGRTAPLMDGLDFHPYPVPQSLPFASGYGDQRFGQRDQPAADLPGVLRPHSTRRRSRRSAGRRAAACSFKPQRDRRRFGLVSPLVAGSMPYSLAILSSGSPIIG